MIVMKFKLSKTKKQTIKKKKKNEVYVGWRKLKSKQFDDFFANFVVDCDCLHKYDHWFSELFIHFSLTTTWSRAQANHKGLEKYMMSAVQNKTLKN